MPSVGHSAIAPSRRSRSIVVIRGTRSFASTSRTSAITSSTKNEKRALVVADRSKGSCQEHRVTAACMGRRREGPSILGGTSEEYRHEPVVHDLRECRDPARSDAYGRADRAPHIVPHLCG